MALAPLARGGALGIGCLPSSAPRALGALRCSSVQAAERAAVLWRCTGVTSMQLVDDRHLEAQAKARVLREALPWITRWAGRTIVVKYGGNVGTDDDLLPAFAADVALLHRVGLRVVVVHGGGPQISALADALHLRSEFVDGRRVTDAAMLQAVQMALLGQVNPVLVGLVQQAGAPAVGVAGTDGLLTGCVTEPALGLVGEIAAVDIALLGTLLDAGKVPVVAPLARDASGQVLNVNADTAAGAIATALAADKLITLTNVEGLYQHFGTSEQSLLSEVPLAQLRALLASGSLTTGMVPKVASVVAAVEGGVERAHLLDGRVEHALLLEIFTDSGIGTMVLPDAVLPDAPPDGAPPHGAR